MNFTHQIYTTDMNTSILYSQLIDRIKNLKHNRTIDDKSLIILFIAYTLLIILSALGNGLVCLTFLKKPEIRTKRNLFIVNLALSDLILCLFTMPFSLLEIVFKYWSLGFLLCKLVAGLEATSIYVSTFSIMAIALDRYHVIIHSQQKSCKPMRSAIILISIWSTAILLSSPLYFYRTLETENIQETFQREFPSIKLPKLNITFEVCVEGWPMKNGRAVYSIFAFFVQYFVPILVVSIAYLQIYLKLNKRFKFKTQLAQRKIHQKARARRTNLFLINIALIFGISWLPLNILNILNDNTDLFDDPARFRIVFACCHMIGMSSACSNPLLYGWLNENFKREFKHVLLRCRNSVKRTSSNYSTPSLQCSIPGNNSSINENKFKIENSRNATSFEITNESNSLKRKNLPKNLSLKTYSMINLNNIPKNTNIKFTKENS